MITIKLKEASKDSPYMFFNRLFCSKGINLAYNTFKSQYPYLDEHPEYVAYDDVNLAVILDDPIISEEGEFISHNTVYLFEHFISPILRSERIKYIDFLDERLDSFSGLNVKEERILFMEEIKSKILDALNYITKIKKDSLKQLLHNEVLTHKVDIDNRLRHLIELPSREIKYQSIIEKASNILFNNVSERNIFLDLFKSSTWTNYTLQKIYEYDLKSVVYLFHLLKEKEFRSFQNTKIVQLKLFIGNKSKKPITQGTFDSTKNDVLKTGCKNKTEIDKLFVK